MCLTGSSTAETACAVELERFRLWNEDLRSTRWKSETVSGLITYILVGAKLTNSPKYDAQPHAGAPTVPEVCGGVCVGACTRCVRYASAAAFY